LGLKICTDVNNKYEKGLFDIFFGEKKVFIFAKIENHVATFPYWFWFGENFLNV
jgi:hypothetical protein